MDPISAIFVMVVLTGAFAKGVDIATDGLLSAEVGGGVRGVSHYAVQAGKARWRLANAKAREIRTQSPQGRKVQEILDLAGMFVRVLSGEAVRFGSGVRSSWRSGREQERSVRTERRGDAPWPVTQWLLERAERTRTRLAERAERIRTATSNEDPNGASSGPEPVPNTTTGVDPNGDPDDIWQDPPTTGTVCPPTGRRLCERCGERPWTTRYRDPWGGQIDSGSIDSALERPLHICDQCAREIEAERNGDPDPNEGGLREGDVSPDACTKVIRWQQVPGEYRTEPIFCGRPGNMDGLAYRCPQHQEDQAAEGKLWGEVARGGGCIEVTGWVAEGGQRWPRYCGAEREPGWVLCPAHLAAKRADPNYPQDDIDEYREDPDHLGPDDYRSIPDPDTDPAPPMKGTSMDINSAPAAIAAAEALRGRFEEPESLLASLSQDAVTTLEGMGDFGTGDETDTAGRFQPVIDALSSAREAWDVYVAALHEEWDEHIAAAEGRTAGAHAPFQEV